MTPQEGHPQHKGADDRPGGFKLQGFGGRHTEALPDRKDL